MPQFEVIPEICRKLLAESITDDLNRYSEWLKLGSAFEIFYQVYRHSVKPDLRISEIIKNWFLGQVIETDSAVPDLLNEHTNKHTLFRFK